MKLYVDDLRPLPSEDWHLARTITEAVRLLATGYVEEASIDHDITIVKRNKIGLTVPVCNDDEGTLISNLETFEPVVRYIAAMPAETRPKVIKCHSANPDAYILYESILSSVGLHLTK